MRALRLAAAWVPVLVLAGWTLMRAGGFERGFPLVAIVAFTPQLALASLAVVALAVALRVRAAALVAGVCALVLAVLVLPRGIPAGDPGEGPVLRVMTANLHLGEVPAPVLVDAALRVRADLLAVQELTDGQAYAIDRAGIRRVLPHARLRHAPMAGGTGLYSRWPLALRARPPGINEQTAVWMPGVGVVVSVHAPAPTRTRTGVWRRDLRALPEDAAMLLGDFNATLDHAELRRIVDRGYTDAADAAGAGLRTTWPAHRLWAGVAIDHVLVRPPWRVRAVEILELPRTDHRALVAELVRVP